jgi:hypothetical protein
MTEEQRDLNRRIKLERQNETPREKADRAADTMTMVVMCVVLFLITGLIYH